MAHIDPADVEYVWTPITGNEKEKHPLCTFRLLGLRTTTPGKMSKELEISIRRMQKSLFGNTQWIYFHSGYDIQKCYITEHEESYDDILLYQSEGKPTINISAIVGQNGAGKSTMVDMMIRILNNLSAAIIGESYAYESAEHLHYIENVYGELAVLINDFILIVRVTGRLIKLDKYIKVKDKNIYRVSHKESVVVLNDTKKEPHLLEQQPDKFHILNDWFYSIVCNYSLYSFNYRDYYGERTNDERLKLLGKTITDKNPDDAFWLKGVFHKNDGYQTPVVIHPMRINGIIDAVKENYLAKERILNLLFEKDDHDNYLFREINGTHRIVGLVFLPYDYYEYNRDRMCATLGLSSNTSIAKHFVEIYDCIVEFWKETYGFEVDSFVGRFEQAQDYIVYKTVKIAKIYKQYRKLWKTLSKRTFNKDECKTLLTEIYHDRSHITTKLRRTLSFLTFHKTSEDYLTKSVVVRLEDIQSWILARINKGYDKISFRLSFEDLLPPPIFDVQLQIVENTKIAADGSFDDKDVIPFQGLSSGERQIAYTMSNLMYHLYNINSASSDYNSDKDHQSMIHYRYVNVMFDEVELYFHPELQRKFVKYIVSALHSSTLNSIKGVNIVMITHSPFVLSDVPESNTVFLSKDKSSNPYGHTFGANIHAMLNNRFMMSSTIGEHARDCIDKMIIAYNETDERRRKQLYLKDRLLFAFMADSIGDDYLRKVVRRMYNEMHDQYESADVILNEIHRYEARIKELKEQLPK